ncbi:MAG: hypothetical protein QG593_225 [Patescibacteria group bacterium]|jgi:hypothetical protein|nr:hypothetical protein [Patescibacteria group bacterium]
MNNPETQNNSQTVIERVEGLPRKILMIGVAALSAVVAIGASFNLIDFGGDLGPGYDPLASED